MSRNKCRWKLAHANTWINVTTGHTRSDLVNLAGTVVLSYDITGPAERLSSTSVSVYITDSGNNGTTVYRLVKIASTYLWQFKEPEY